MAKPFKGVVNVELTELVPTGSPILGGYPWAFVGGTIKRAVIDVSGDPFVDLAQEARMALARD